MLKPSKDKLEIRRFEVKIKVYNQREKYAENQLVELKEKWKKREDDQREGLKNADKLSKPYQLGIINAIGEPINNDMN